MEYVWLAVLWSGWCLLHSVLASLRVRTYVRDRFPDKSRYFRLAYNLVAVITLLPVLAYSFSLHGPVFLQWQGPWVVLQAFMIIGGLILFIAPLKNYDMSRFMGWRQITDGEQHSSLTDGTTLDTSGVLGYIRHPWYSGAILLIWARDLDMPTLIVNTIITAYFFIGARFEERKLVYELGDEYRRYQQTAGMFLPRISRREGAK